MKSLNQVDKQINPIVWSDSFIWKFEAWPVFTSVYTLSANPGKLKYYYTWSNFINYFSSGQMEAYIPKDLITIGNKTILELINGNDEFIQTSNVVQKDILDAIKICEKHKHSVQEIDEWYPSIHVALSNAAAILFSFDYALNDYLKELNTSNPTLFNQINQAIVEKEPSFLKQANQYLLSIVNEYNFDFNKITPIFNSKFGWIQNSYKGKFIITKDWLENHYLRIKDASNNEIVSNLQLDIPKKYSLLVNAAVNAITFRDNKKKLLLFAVELIEVWLKYICVKENYIYDELKWLTIDEVLDLINNGNSLLEDKARTYSNENSRYGLMFDKGYYDISKDLFIKVREAYNSISNQQELKGVPASKGIIRGKVKIIFDPKDTNISFNDGDILVTSMTRPEFLLFMNKASAIITDEGGITCHAGIVSRELGIPCIIATKIATKVLKDDDFVEVDANKGIIKILS